MKDAQDLYEEAEDQEEVDLIGSIARVPLRLLRRDIREAAGLMSKEEARFLVSMYYRIQKDRIAVQAQLREMIKADNPKLTADEVKDIISYMREPDWLPDLFLGWVFRVMHDIEDDIKKALQDYTDREYMGAWAKRTVGIGPVIAAGLAAHIDIEKAKTAGSIWRLAGLDPTSKWGKGEKRPWDAELKTLCWKAGESFVKVQNRKGDVYGHLYAKRKAYEAALNDQGQYADQAKARAEGAKNKGTVAYQSYKEGRLPLGHLHSRAKRWAVKLFLAHYFEEAYRHHYGKEPPEPYSIVMLGHVHKI